MKITKMLAPDFDRFYRHGRELGKIYADFRDHAQGAVCVGGGSNLTTGDGAGIPSCFKRLAAAGRGSVTCHSSP